MPLSAARKSNTADEYAMLVARYGKPYSIMSTENDSPKPKVPSRSAFFDAGHVKIFFAPIGCVEAWDRAIRVLADSFKYPAMAEDELSRIKACVPQASAGWTIVGYIDTSDSEPISAELAGMRLDKISVKRTADPVLDTSDPDKQTPPKRETAAERRSRHLQEQMERDAEAAGQKRTEIRRGCQIIYLTTSDKKLSDLTVKELQQVQACQTLGLYPP